MTARTLIAGVAAIVFGVVLVRLFTVHETLTERTRRKASALEQSWAFGDDVPPLSSTKSMTGHGLGAAGAQEAVYCLLMMEHAFIAPSINIDELDDSARGYPIVRETRSGVQLDTVLSNSFGFGGTNACLVLSRMRT